MSRRSKKRKPESEDQTIADGEQDNVFFDEINEMKMMWEIPQISHFLHLTRESLNVPQFSIYEMERMLMIPKASKQLANIMTCLLSSPITKAKLRKIPPMPYEFWTNILAHKVTSWFKVYYAKHKDTTKVLETIGVEPEFWNIFSDVSLLNSKGFEGLSFKQRVWLLKTICDTIMHTRKTVQEDIAKQPCKDQYETILGLDRYGARYIYFPQFIVSDLRIYRHCLDNKVLSTVKPARSKQRAIAETSNSIGARLRRYRKRSSHDSSSGRSSAREMSEDKDINGYKYGNDSATSSFTSEDTNLSSTSTCSNNNINLDTINGKRCRSLSKTSEESVFSNAKSSGYDTNASNDNKFLDDDDSPQMFKGFPNIQGDNCNIGIINEILDDLRTEIEEEKKVNECKSDTKSINKLIAQENFVGSHKDTAGSCIEITAAMKNESERMVDNLSDSSKTDDEKLNERISAENTKLPEDVYSKNISTNISNVDDNISTTSKSDDEKLSETKSSGSNISTNGVKNSLSRNITFHNRSFRASSNGSTLLNEKVTKRECFNGNKIFSSSTEKELSDSIEEESLSKRLELLSQYRATQRDETEDLKGEIELEDDKMDDADDKTSFSSDIRFEVEEDDLDDYVNNSNNGYNLRKSKRTEESKQHFNNILSNLNVSDFQLVADSVDGLKDLISSFSTSNSGSDGTINTEVISPSEIKLVKNLTELLKTLEKVETTLKNAMRKAKLKLQREWSNFKEGSVEDQDSSGEGGLSSNWWVLGSQGCPLSAPGDATLQTLPQSTISSFGTQDQQPRPENECESADNCITEQNYQKNLENNELRNNVEKSAGEVQGRKQAKKEEGQTRERKQREKNEATSNNEEAEQQTRRVLRARGVSSYTEQFYSDDESDENELEEWTDIEAVYAAPGTSTDTSITHTNPKVRHADDWSSETEDSDQDWILPGSRKRKNKRSSTNRRLKSLQHKQNIKESISQSNVTSHPAIIKTSRDKSKDKSKDIKSKENKMRTLVDSAQVSSNGNVTNSACNTNSKRAIPPTNTICKIETIGSVHSELDIKDEGPMYESTANCYIENYGQNPQQNYVMINTSSNIQPVNYVIPENPAIGASIMPQASVMQNSTIVAGIAPPIHQGYYVQSAPNYVIQNSQLTFLPIAQQQQPIFQQQARSFITIAPKPSIESYSQQRPQNPVCYAQRSQNSFSQSNRHIAPRQNPPHSNGTMVKNNVPVQGQKPTDFRSVRSNTSQQCQTSNPKAAPRQRQARQKASLTESGSRKTTSLIMLSDSDDEIEMIITEKTATTATATTTTATTVTAAKKTATSSAKQQTPENPVNQARQKPTITSDVLVSPTKDVIPPTRDVIPPQILERMNQGGISITPVKTVVPAAPPANANTQLVVVVNETGSHYALALPNGSKLILTPEQVAQIRASNGGKLIL